MPVFRFGRGLLARCSRGRRGRTLLACLPRIQCDRLETRVTNVSLICDLWRRAAYAAAGWTRVSN